MRFRRVFCFTIGLEIFLLGVNARGSYVVEAEGAAVNAGSLASGADFDFVAHDFGMEAKDAIRMSLDKLGSAGTLQGNLLSSAPGEDYSDYDSDYAPRAATGPAASTAGGASNALLTTASDSLPEGMQGFSPIDINTIFWILGPSESASFSQVMAARFGFYGGR